MYDSFAKHKLAIERARVEIENTKVTAGDVRMHERLVNEYITRLARCRAHAGHDGRQDCPGDCDDGRGD
jgi:hypothetical protein